MLVVVTPVAYGLSVGCAAIIGVGLCVAAHRSPGPWQVVAARAIGLLLAADAFTYTVSAIVQGQWSASSSLPLALCNMAVLVAAAACWWQIPLLVELTWFWGLAGTIQAVLTPDLQVGFPHLVFFEYVVGHTAIVLAGVFLVVGMGVTPRPGAVPRVFAITAGYTVFVGAIDAATGANYMFLQRRPTNWTLLKVLGPWPWYILSAAGVAVLLLVVLDTPFRIARRRPSAPPRIPGPPGPPLPSLPAGDCLGEPHAPVSAG
jgi:hypothetical integral membrane protein (TIGR02206 family)